MAAPPQPPQPPPEPEPPGPPAAVPIPYERAEFATAIVFSVLAEARARLAQIDRALGLPNGRGTNTYCDIMSVANGTRYVIPIIPMASGRATPTGAERYCSVAWETAGNGTVTGWCGDKRAAEVPTPEVILNTTKVSPTAW